jgi:hypothetical protein
LLSSLWASIIYRETVGFRNSSNSLFSDTLLNPIDRIQLFSQDRVSEEKKTVCAGPLNRSIGLEKKLLEGLKESGDQRGYISLKDRQHEST